MIAVFLALFFVLAIVLILKTRARRIAFLAIVAALIIGGLAFPDVDMWRNILGTGDYVTVVNVTEADLHDVVLAFSGGDREEIGFMPKGTMRTVTLRPRDSVSLELEYTINGVRKRIEAGTISTSPEDRTITLWTGGDSAILTWGAEASSSISSASTPR